MFGLPPYLRKAAPSVPIKRGSNGPDKKSARKGKRKGRKEREKGGKMRDQIAKKKKKKKKKKNLHAQTFSNRDPCAMTFCECKILAVFDCEE